MVVDLQDTPKITSCCGRKGHWYAYANQPIENWIDLHETETFANWTASPHYRSASDQKLAYFFWTGTRYEAIIHGKKENMENKNNEEKRWKKEKTCCTKKPVRTHPHHMLPLPYETTVDNKSQLHR